MSQSKVVNGHTWKLHAQSYILKYGTGQCDKLKLHPSNIRMQPKITNQSGISEIKNLVQDIVSVTPLADEKHKICASEQCNTLTFLYRYFHSKKLQY